MKKVLTAALALSALMLAGGATQVKAQSQPGPGIVPEENVPQPAVKKTDQPAKAGVMSGHLNDTGTIFVADEDLKSWKVNNPGAVKHYKNERVTMHVIQNFRTGSVTVQSVRTPDLKLSASPNPN